MLQVVDTSKEITDIPEWFHGCKLNYAENLLKCAQGNKPALITCGTYCSASHFQSVTPLPPTTRRGPGAGVHILL